MMWTTHMSCCGGGSQQKTGCHVFSHLVLSDRNFKLVFWHLLPAPVIGAQQCRLLPFSSAEWMDKVFFESTSDMVLAHGVELSCMDVIRQG